MQLINRFTIFTKRILIQKTYLIMLLSIIILSVIYVFLPSKNQSTDIKVCLYCEDDSDYYLEVINELNNKNSIYTFYTVASKDSLLNDVNSKKAECGYFIPRGFFEDYIKGTADANPIINYLSPASVLNTAINESFYSVVMEVCSNDILTYSVNLPEYENELSDTLDDYMNSDDIFKIQDVADGTINHQTYQHKINIPIYELSLILILASGLMGLLLYYQDKEKGLYTPLSTMATESIKLISITTAIMPILLVGIITTVIIQGTISITLSLLIYSFLVLIFSLIISLFIKKSKHLATVIPIILLLGVIGSFAYNLI